MLKIYGNASVKYKSRIIVMFLVFLFVFLLILKFSAKNKIEKFSKNKEFELFGKINRSKEDITKGFMYRTQPLEDKEAMLFDMGVEKNHSMWMKNTHLSLDILFLDRNFKVVGFVENAAPRSLERLSIGKKSRYVVETKAGYVKKHQLKQGDTIKFNEI